MRFFYSSMTKGFYLEGYFSEPPDDAVEINEEEWRKLRAAQGEGKDIEVQGGRPIPIDPPPAPEPTLADLLEEKILALEAQQTPDRIRKAVLGIDEGWLADLNSQIDALRAELSALQVAQ